MKTHASAHTPSPAIPLLAIPLFAIACLAILFFAANALARQAPAAPAAFAGGSGPQGAVCTSTDGKSTCACAAKCQAKAGSCQCYGIPPASDATQRSPGNLLDPNARRKAVCTSGDGKKTCTCGDKGCNATPIGCNCLTE